MGNRDYDPNDDAPARENREWQRRMREEANRGYRGGHLSGGAEGNRGALGSGYLGPINFRTGGLIGGTRNSGYGAGGLWPNMDATMDGYSTTMGDEMDVDGYPPPHRHGGYGGFDTGNPNYAGRGSKNYRRSDTRIEEDVHEALMRDPYLDATDIDVAVKDGEVTLTGEVENRQARRRAEECVERCAGVCDVHNELKARQGLMGRGSPDRDVTTQATRDDR